MNEELAREYYVKIKTLREHAQRLTNKIDELDEQTLHIREMITAVQQSTEIPENTEMLAQLTQGVMIQATSRPVKYVWLNVGADTVVKKTPQQAAQLLEEQQEELASLREELLTQQKDVAAQAEKIEQEAAEHVDV